MSAATFWRTTSFSWQVMWGPMQDLYTSQRKDMDMRFPSLFDFSKHFYNVCSIHKHGWKRRSWELGVKKPFTQHWEQFAVHCLAQGPFPALTAQVGDGSTNPPARGQSTLTPEPRSACIAFQLYRKTKNWKFSSPDAVCQMHFDQLCPHFLPDGTKTLFGQNLVTNQKY